MADSTMYGAFVPTNWIWDIQQLQQIEGINPQLKELLVRLYQNINTMALVLNIKDSAQYGTQPYVNGQLFFPNPAFNSSTENVAAQRQVFRLVVNFGALPNATTKSVAHKLPITSKYTFTRIYGAASDPSTEFIPLPYVSAAGTDPVELWVDGTNVNVTTTTNLSAFTTTYIVLEYITS